MLTGVSAKMPLRGNCYLTSHILSWLWKVVFLVEAEGLLLDWFGIGYSLHWKSRSHLFWAL